MLSSMRRRVHVGQPNDTVKNYQSEYHSDRDVFFDFPATCGSPNMFDTNVTLRQITRRPPGYGFHCTLELDTCAIVMGKKAAAHIPADESLSTSGSISSQTSTKEGMFEIFGPYERRQGINKS
jgi:hypothetical protein